MAMTPKRPVAANVDAYIRGFPPDVQALLERMRSTVRRAAPDAEEFISYGMPAYRQSSQRASKPKSTIWASNTSQKRSCNRSGGL